MPSRSRGARAWQLTCTAMPTTAATRNGTFLPRATSPASSVHPAVPSARLWRIIAGAAAVLCPVGWDEPFGLVAAEAQACATPVVAYRRGGLQDIIVDGVTGFLVAPGDSDAAASALCRATELDRTGCRRHAEAQLDIEAVLDAHERAYRDIVTSALATTHG